MATAGRPSGAPPAVSAQRGRPQAYARCQRVPSGFPAGSSPSPRLRRCRLRAPGEARRAPAVPRAATAPQRPSAQRAALHGHRDTRFTASAGNARLHGDGRRGYGLPWRRGLAAGAAPPCRPGRPGSSPAPAAGSP